MIELVRFVPSADIWTGGTQPFLLATSQAPCRSFKMLPAEVREAQWSPILIGGWCKRWPAVMGKLQGIDNIPAER